MKIAAKLGHVNCLKALQELGSIWNHHVTQISATDRNFSCLRYAIEEGCNLHEYSAYNAALFGHVACLEFIYESLAV